MAIGVARCVGARPDRKSTNFMDIDAGYSIAGIRFAAELAAGPIAAFPGKSRPNDHDVGLGGARRRCRWLAIVATGPRGTVMVRTLEGTIGSAVAVKATVSNMTSMRGRASSTRMLTTSEPRLVCEAVIESLPRCLGSIGERSLSSAFLSRINHDERVTARGKSPISTSLQSFRLETTAASAH
jgi:hypothetical protein